MVDRIRRGKEKCSCRDDENSPNEQPRNAYCLQPGFSGGNHDTVKQEAMNNLQCSQDPKQMHSSSSPYGMPGYRSTVPNSRYLKATQPLLDEVVNVKKALKQLEAKHQGAGSKAPERVKGDQKTAIQCLLRAEFLLIVKNTLFLRLNSNLQESLWFAPLTDDPLVHCNVQPYLP